MRGRHVVVWTDVACRDLECLVDRLVLESPSAAARCLARLRGAGASLTALPGRGRVVPELADYGITKYREIIVAPWRIVYTVQGRDVAVLAVLDGRRNVEDLLLERLTRT